MSVVSPTGLKTVCLQNIVCSVNLSVCESFKEWSHGRGKKCRKQNEGFLDYKALYLLSWLLFKWTAVSHIQERRRMW